MTITKRHIEKNLENKNWKKNNCVDIQGDKLMKCHKR